MNKECKLHGVTEFAKRSEGGWRCKKCRSAAVTKRRRKVKRILVEEFGGKCTVCGYNKCIAALSFHHPNNNKEFGISAKGMGRALNKLRKEAKKCILICMNCHTEIHNAI